eukprot:jgi/Bigna1/133945/aug1.23_g8653
MTAFHLLSLPFSIAGRIAILRPEPSPPVAGNCSFTSVGCYLLTRSIIRSFVSPDTSIDQLRNDALRGYQLTSRASVSHVNYSTALLVGDSDGALASSFGDYDSRAHTTLYGEWIVAVPWESEIPTPNGQFNADLAVVRVFLYFHGGAHVLGKASQDSRVMEEFALGLHAAPAAILNANYRLLPEHDPKTQLADAISAYLFLVESGIRPENVIVGGCSAGATIAWRVATELQEHARPRALVLQSPGTLSGERTHFREYANFKDNAKVCTLGGEGIMSLVEQQWKKRGVEDIEYFKLHHLPESTLRTLPPTLVLASDFELMIDAIQENVAYLKELGAEITLKLSQCLYHCPLSGAWPAIPLLFGAEEAVEELHHTIEWMQAQWNRPVPT